MEDKTYTADDIDEVLQHGDIWAQLPEPIKAPWEASEDEACPEPKRVNASAIIRQLRAELKTCKGAFDVVSVVSDAREAKLKALKDKVIFLPWDAEVKLGDVIEIGVSGTDTIEFCHVVEVKGKMGVFSLENTEYGLGEIFYEVEGRQTILKRDNKPVVMPDKPTNKGEEL